MTSFQLRIPTVTDPFDVPPSRLRAGRAALLSALFLVVTLCAFFVREVIELR